LKRNLSLLALVSVIFFNVCGGPYALEDVLTAGPGLSLLLIVITPVFWALPVALVCAELVTALPEEGGYYAWSKRALGPFWAFCQGWWAWLFTIVDLVLYPKMFCQYLKYFAPMFGEDANVWAHKGMMIAVIWVFIFLNLRGAHAIGSFTKLFAVLVISPFAVMAVWGCYRAVTEGFPFTPTQPLLHPTHTLATGLATALPYALWNYQGWDAISTVAGEMDDPRRNYPKALMIATLVIIAVYAIPAFVALGFVGTDYKWHVGGWSDVAERIAGPWLGAWVSAMGMASALGLFASLVLVYSRIPYVMAVDGFLPKPLRACNVFGAPTFALITCGILYTAVALAFDNIDDLTALDVTILAAVMAMELASFLVLRWREPDLPRPFRVPGGWFVAGLMCVLPLACICASVYYRAREAGVGPVLGNAALLMATGPLLYPFAARWRRFTSEP